MHFAYDSFAHLSFDHLRPHVSLDNVALPHVTDSKHEARLPVPLTDDRVPREQQRLRSLLGPGKLGENYPHHECLQYHTCHRLDTYDEHSLRTLVRRVLRSVPTIFFPSIRPSFLSQSYIITRFFLENKNLHEYKRRSNVEDNGIPLCEIPV